MQCDANLNESKPHSKPAKHPYGFFSNTVLSKLYCACAKTTAISDILILILIPGVFLNLDTLLEDPVVVDEGAVG